jgi:hypothetical protein
VCEVINCIHVAQSKFLGLAFVVTVMNLQVPQEAGIIVTSLALSPSQEGISYVELLVIRTLYWGWYLGPIAVYTSVVCFSVIITQGTTSTTFIIGRVAPMCGSIFRRQLTFVLYIILPDDGPMRTETCSGKQ